jgi:hypothetical protein
MSERKQLQEMLAFDSGRPVCHFKVDLSRSMLCNELQRGGHQRSRSLVQPDLCTYSERAPRFARTLARVEVRNRWELAIIDE